MIDRERAVTVLSLSVVLLVGGYWLLGPTGPLAGLLHTTDYDTATVTVVDENGTNLTTVDVRVADTDRELYVGLSKTDSLSAGEGMLFVHEVPGEYGYVMRNMSFPLDIVFIAKNGTITTIHHAPTPENADGDREYTGTGKYVLEVPRGYTNATGIDPGDRVRIPSSVGR